MLLYLVEFDIMSTIVLPECSDMSTDDSATVFVYAGAPGAAAIVLVLGVFSAHA
jgi:hypothetical protein